jgi:hypothetical protein
MTRAGCVTLVTEQNKTWIAEVAARGEGSEEVLKQCVPRTARVADTHVDPAVISHRDMCLLHTATTRRDARLVRPVLRPFRPGAQWTPTSL